MARKPAAPTAAPIDFFGAAPILQTKTSKKAGNPSVEMENIADLCALDRVMGDLEAARAIVDGEIRDAARARFVTEGVASKSRPGNWKGSEIETVDGELLTHSVSVELRRSGAKLSEEACTLLDENNIPYETVQEVAATFVINPAHLGNADLLKRVKEALNGVEGIPADFIMAQTGSKKHVTTDETIATLFQQPAAVIEAILPVVTTLSVGKAKFAAPAGADELEVAMDRAGKLLGRPLFRSKIDENAGGSAADKRKNFRVVA